MENRKLPNEYVRDNNGVPYINLDILPISPLKMDFSSEEESTPTINNNCSFYKTSSSDYILKIYNDNNKIIDNMREFITSLIEYQKKIKMIELPVGYVIKSWYPCGQIIRYYGNTPSLRKLCYDGDLEELKKYYCHSEDNLKNLFYLYSDILVLLEELFDNGISYMDIHGGNFVFLNNQVKLIDFDGKYISYITNSFSLNNVLLNYLTMINKLLRRLDYIGMDIDSNILTFPSVRIKMKKLENDCRRYK